MWHRLLAGFWCRVQAPEKYTSMVYVSASLTLLEIRTAWIVYIFKQPFSLFLVPRLSWKKIQINDWRTILFSSNSYLLRFRSSAGFFFTYLLVYDGVIWREYVLGNCFHNQFSFYDSYQAQFEPYLCNTRLKIRYFLCCCLSVYFNPLTLQNRCRRRHVTGS